MIVRWGWVTLGVLATGVVVGACGDASQVPLGDPRGGGGAGGTGGSSGEAECPNGPLAAPLPGCAPAPLPSTGDLHVDCVDRINQLRWECQCLPPLHRWLEAEACANQQAQYDSTNGPHAGFSADLCSPDGRGQNECPGWPSTSNVISGCLQAMWDEGPGEPFSQHGHYINMSDARHTRVACGFYTTQSGDVWSVQNFQ